MSLAQEKLIKLKEILKNYKRVIIAYSGGVDSTFLAKVAYDVLGDDALAVTINTDVFSKREYTDAKDFANEIGIKQKIINSDVFEIEGFVENSKNRCYHCKKNVFSKLIDLAKEEGFLYVIEGSNKDDESDFRPGHKAVSELSVLSPLREVGLSKSEVRELSSALGLHSAAKPSFACLSSRFPYGEVITKEKVDLVEAAEDFLFNLGFSQLRVRHHNGLARIEILNDDIEKFLLQSHEISKKFKQLGFSYITLDLDGFRTGSMNEIL